MITEKNSFAMKNILESTSKPLVDSIELKEMAREHLLKEVNAEMQRISQTNIESQQIIGLLEEIKQSIKDNSEQNKEQNELKMQVLKKLKAKLETS